jgi:hypothetical protein
VSDPAVGPLIDQLVNAQKGASQAHSATGYGREMSANV